MQPDSTRDDILEFVARVPRTGDVDALTREGVQDLRRMGGRHSGVRRQPAAQRR
jgi:hypothetical protein